MLASRFVTTAAVWVLAAGPVLLGGPLAAQKLLILPPEAARRVPDIHTEAASQLVFCGTPSRRIACRVQYLYSTGKIPLTGAWFKALRLRQHHFAEQPWGRFTLDVTVGHGPAVSQANAEFAKNLMTAVSKVFSGTVDLPATKPSSPPAPWAVTIPFSKPALYAKALGKSWVVDFTSGASLTKRSWVVEGWTRAHAWLNWSQVQPGCLASHGRPTIWATVIVSSIIPGGSLWVMLDGYPPVQSLAQNATFLSSRGLGSQVGPWKTPFLLRDANLPARPGCRWLIGMPRIIYPMKLFFVRFNGQLMGRLASTVPLPNDPSIGGARFFFQNIALEKDGALHPSLALGLTVGTGKLPPGARVMAVYDPTRPWRRGNVVPGELATVAFDY